MRRLALSALFLTSCSSPPPKPIPPPAVSVGIGATPVAPPIVVEPDPNLVLPCRDAGESERIVQDLDAKMWSIKAADPIAPAIADLEKLFSTPCFALARIDHDVEPSSFKTGAALHRWWFDGGATWARSYLPSPLPRSIVLAPTPRGTLTLENGEPALKPLLCPLSALDDKSCGAETAGWRIRAASAQQHVSNSDSKGSFCEGWARSHKSDTSRYSLYRSCLSDGARSDVLPLGAYRAPQDGWLVVTTSHMISYQGCQEEMSLYDLASGSAYLFECRNQKTPAKVWIGRGPTGAIREAAWMMMLQHKAESVRLQAEYHSVPSDFPVARRREENIESMRTIVSVSDSPYVTWAWVRGSPLKGVLSGRFDTSSNSLSSYAHSLLNIAGAAFQEGCAPQSSPRNIPWNDLGPRVDTPLADEPPLFDRFGDAKAKLAAAPPAKPGCAMLP